MIKKIIITLILVFFSLNNSFAKYNVDTKIQKIVSNFFIKIEKKYNREKEKIFLEKINSKINKILERKKLNSKKEKLLNDILVLFNEKIFEIEYKKSLENKKQIFIENKIFIDLKEKLEKIKIPNYLRNVSKKIIKISEKQEFIENSEIKKINFSRYYLVDSSNYKQLNAKNGIFLVNFDQKIFFVEKYNIETKIKYSNAGKLFVGYINKNTKFFEENNIFYSYNFKLYKFFDDKYGFYKTTLKQNNINTKNTILYFGDNNKYNFISDYKKVKLINGDIIYGVVDKYNFLQDLVNDKLYLTGETDELFEKLKQEIIKITKNKTKSEKIKTIYNFILKNLEYSKKLNLEDKKIFSGILSYKNKNGVCEAYVKLMSYALKFAGIKDAKVIRGDVIDAIDFPKIGHAWIKIGEKYYDPTFDDPIGNTKTKTFKEYKYFALPKDLFYANRFSYGTTPEYLKTKSLDYRINYINKNLEKLLEKYKNKNYKLLEGVKFNKQNNIEIGENITIEEAKKIIPFYEVTEKSSGELVFYDNGKKKNITKLQYYTITDQNLGQILAQLHYNLEGLYLFKWEKNGKIEYRLGFNVEVK